MDLKRRRSSAASNVFGRQLSVSLMPYLACVCLLSCMHIGVCVHVVVHGQLFSK